VKAKVIPLIIGATDTISKSLGQYLSNVTGEHAVKETGGKKKIKRKSHIGWTQRSNCGKC